MAAAREGETASSKGATSKGATLKGRRGEGAVSAPLEERDALQLERRLAEEREGLLRPAPRAGGRLPTLRVVKSAGRRRAGRRHRNGFYLPALRCLCWKRLRRRRRHCVLT